MSEDISTATPQKKVDSDSSVQACPSHEDDLFSQMQKDFDAMVHQDDDLPEASERFSITPLNHHHITSFDHTQPGNNQGFSMNFLTTLGLALLIFTAVAVAICSFALNSKDKTTVAVAMTAAKSVAQPVITNQQPGKQADKSAQQDPTTAAPTQAPDKLWVIFLTSVADNNAALQILNRLKADGIDCNSMAIQIGNKTWHRVYAQGFSSSDQARARMPALVGKYHFQSPWIGKLPTAGKTH